MWNVGKWQRDFLRHLFRLALSFRGKFNFLNMGRDKTFAARVNVRQLDEQYFTPCAVGNDGEKAFEAKVYINSWKCWAKVVVVQQYDTKGQIKSATAFAST